MQRSIEGKTKAPGAEGREVVNPGSPRTLTDEEVVTERRVARRSFLTAAGTLLAGGALAIVSGRPAAAQEPDADAKPQKKDNDADKKKEAGAKSKKTKKAKGEKDTDADKGKEKKEEKDSDQ
jgi:hypothetical protein